jgi:acetyl-CoA acetyltransferase
VSFYSVAIEVSSIQLTICQAAVERVPEIKPEQVEEVFFGNVLSAK